MVTVVLASASPRRRKLLEELGVPFEVDVSAFDEVMDQAVPSAELVTQLAHGKAADVFARRPDDVVIGADTIVVFEGEYLGKPVDERSAAAQLRKMAGRTVSIFTGVAVLSPSHTLRRSVEVAARIKNLDDDELARYLDSGSYGDKAGGVSVEIIEHIDGPVDAVLGLPLRELAEVLRTAGIEVSPARY